jgi:hypothetical protein
VTQSACIISPLGRQHPGVCHRCGWNGPVCSIPLRGLRHLKTAVAFGRICEECAEDLLANPCLSLVSAGRTCTELTVTRHDDRQRPRTALQSLSLVV